MLYSERQMGHAGLLHKNAIEGSGSLEAGRGGVYRASTGSAMYYLWHANEIGASPDGRRKGEPFGTNFSASLFARINGPLSVVQSVTKPDFTENTNGGSLTLEFVSSMFQDEEWIYGFGDLPKGGKTF